MCKRDVPDPLDPETQTTELEQVLAWQQELGWQPGPIQVKHFQLPDHRIYIADYPSWGIIFHADPFFYPTEAERAEFRKMVEEWDKSAQFVFWWEKDYYMDKDGKVVST